MRTTAILALLFVGLFYMWASTGAQIMQCALSIDLADDVKVDDVEAPGAWLAGLLDARNESPAPPYAVREIDSL
jgi:hypothetical protein